MLFVTILLFFSSSNAQSNLNTVDASNPIRIPHNLCWIPPQPQNGRYKVLHPTGRLAPRVTKFTLEILCDPGYHRTASIYRCERGVYENSMPDCLPYCKKARSGVLSCGLGAKNVEAKCLLQRDLYRMDMKTSPIEEELNCGYMRPPVNSLAGGRSALKQEVPWHAGIYTKTTKPYMQICSGSLVKKNVVISVAHCFWSDVDKQQPAYNYAVAVGKLYRPWNDKNDGTSQKSDVAEIRIPPRFQGSATNLQDDIALVIVATPFTFTESVIPVCLDFDSDLDMTQLTPGSLGTVAGWGLTGDNALASPVLKVAEMPVVGIEECIAKSDPSFNVYITSDKICAGYQNGTAVCMGDSGGGLSFPSTISKVKRHYLRGVVSVAPRNQNLCNTLSWAAFTHVFKHADFITETLNGVKTLSLFPATAAGQAPQLMPKLEAPKQTGVHMLMNKRLLDLSNIPGDIEIFIYTQAANGQALVDQGFIKL